MSNPIRTFQRSVELVSEAQYKLSGKKLRLYRWRLVAGEYVGRWQKVPAGRGPVSGWSRSLPASFQP